MPGEQLDGLPWVAQFQVSRGDIAGDEPSVGVGGAIIDGGVDIAEFECMRGVTQEPAFVLVGDRSEGLLTGDAGLQPSYFVAVDQSCGIGSEFDGQVGVLAGDDVGFAHPDHGAQFRGGGP